MTDLVALKAASRWLKAKLTRNVASVAKRLIAPSAKTRYQAVAAKTGVPWAFIAVAHEREGSQDWNTAQTGVRPCPERSRSAARGDGLNR